MDIRVARIEKCAKLMLDEQLAMQNLAKQIHAMAKERPDRRQSSEERQYPESPTRNRTLNERAIDHMYDKVTMNREAFNKMFGDRGDALD